MHLFADYIEPMVAWLHIHPYWALFLAFMVSFSESMAIIGGLIPGSVTMTAIGMLAGSGVMRIDLTLLAATLGAIGGDSLSYLIGYVYSERLNTVWPFRKYPSALAYGKHYFANHGGKSVLIGRFVGPLRSLIPLIAGMMHMSHLSFFTANIISAIGWSLLYVVPGVLIGAAGSELSPESATRLFALVLAALGGLWLLSVAIRWMLIRINHFLRKHFHDFWIWAGKHPHFANSIRRLTPQDETHHYSTMLLYLATILCLALSGWLMALAINGSLDHSINQAVQLFLQSLRIHFFDVFFMCAAEFTGLFTLVSVAVFVLITALYYRDYRSAYYWLSINISFGLLILLTSYAVINQNSWPAIELTFATTLFLALLCHITAYQKNLMTRTLNLGLPLILLVNSIGALYLADNWVIDVLGAWIFGITIVLLHWILYRRKRSLSQNALFPALLSMVIIMSSLIAMLFNYEQAAHNHQPYFAQYVFTDKAWWNQQKPLLPIYRTNRIGKPVSVFNVQYVGSLDYFKATLLSQGWCLENESLFKSLLNHVSTNQGRQDSPLMAQLYLNRKPVLVMTLQPKNGDPKQIIRLWRSNYHLKHFRQPVWIGTINPYSLNNAATINTQLSLQYISNYLSLFPQRKIKLPIPLPTSIPPFYEPKLLLVKEPLIVKTAIPSINTP